MSFSILLAVMIYVIGIFAFLDIFITQWTIDNGNSPVTILEITFVSIAWPLLLLFLIFLYIFEVLKKWNLN